MRIIKLQAENVKRLRVAEITPEGNVVIIGGKNGAGKSSCLDAIQYALAGKSSIPERPIREGEERASVICELDDLVVKRTFTASGGGQLIVANKEGARYQSPQAILDKLTGKLTFDPLDFARMDRRRQLEALRDLVGIDVSELESNRQRVYDQRAEVNRVAARARVKLSEMPEYEDVPETEIRIDNLLAMFEEQRNLEQMAKERKDQIDGADADILATEASLENARQMVVEWQNAVEFYTGKLSGLRELVEEKKAEYTEQFSTLPDPDGIKARIDEALVVNEMVRLNQAKLAAQRELEEIESEAAGLTKMLAQVDQEKAALIASAPFPIAGLGFTDAGVTFRGLPFDQASSAEQLRVSVAMGLALNPKLRVLLIRDGSLLDEDSLRLISEMAEQADAQIWIERVGDGKECSVVIEDGFVQVDDLAKYADDLDLPEGEGNDEQ